MNMEINPSEYKVLIVDDVIDYSRRAGTKVYPLPTK